tara:strand:- start:2731 stop:2850 length:120 start_codon:yes stop_codon:yes gene_type:complete
VNLIHQLKKKKIVKQKRIKSYVCIDDFEEEEDEYEIINK